MARPAIASRGGLAVLLVLLVILLTDPVGAAPPRPTPFDENGNRVAAGEPCEMDKSADTFPFDRFNGRNPPSTGTINIPVLLVDFHGQPGQITAAQFTTILFTPSAGGNFSVRDYYDEVSRNQLTVNGMVHGWYTMPMSYASYVGGQGGHGDTYPFNFQGLVRDAVLAADGAVDFSLYDNDGPDGVPNSADDDGLVDCVYLIFSGYAAESYFPTNGRNRLRSSGGWMDWGWFGPGPMLTNDGVSVQLYAASSELRNTSGNTVRDIGVVCHEIGHLLGLPDMYSTVPNMLVTQLGQWNALGEYSVMAFGSWGAGGTNPDQPTHFTGFEKAMLGWINPVHVSVDLVGATLQDIETSGTIYCDFPFLPGGPPDLNLPQRFWMPSWTKWPPPVEGFIVENRQPIGFDSQLSGSGLVIYHMDGRIASQDYFNGTPPFPNWYSNAMEWSENHPLLDVECADQTGADHTFNADDLDAQNNVGDPGDYFAGTATGFDLFTTPSSIAYNGAASGFAVRNIGASAATMTADLIVGAPPGPGHDIWVKDCPNDDGSVPSTPVCDFWGYRMQYSCPDLWVDNDGDGLSEQPVDGATNQLYIKVRNRGSAGIDFGTVTVYDHTQCLAPPQSPPSQHDPFWGLAKVCSLTVQSLAAGDSMVYQVPWYVPPVPPPPNWHYPPTLGIAVETATDTLAAFGDIDLDNNLAMLTGRKMWIHASEYGKGAREAARDVKLAHLGQAPTGAVDAAAKSLPLPEETSVVLPLNNPFDEVRDILFTVDGDLPPGWTVEVYLPEYMPGPPVPVPFVITMDAGMVTPLEVVVIPDPATVHGDAGEIFVGVYDPMTFPEEMLGGMTVPIEADLNPPLPPTGLWAEIYERDSGIPWYRGAVVSFEPVEYDVTGIEEEQVWYFIRRDTVLDGTPPPDLENWLSPITTDAFWQTPYWEWADVDFPIGWPGPPPHYYLICTDAAGNRSEQSAPLHAPLTADYATHDLGAVRMTVTDQGICGYLEVPGRGHGLQYPKGTASVLWTGGLWVGVDDDHVASRDYNMDPEKDWEKSDAPDGTVAHGWPDDWTPDITAPVEVFTTRYRDTGSTAPLGLLVQQTSVVCGEAPDDRFVILRYRVVNDSPEPLFGVYAGQFLDLDLGDPAGGAPWNNRGDSDPSVGLAWMWAEGEPTHVGVQLLDPLMPANTAFINNPISVHPQNYILEADKYGFLVGSDPDHSLPAAATADDWGVCVSAGPFDLQPGDEQLFTVAIVAGDDLADCQAGADAAQAFYAGLVTGVDGGQEGSPVPTSLVLAPNAPNPFNPLTEIRYGLPRDGYVDVGVYNLLGQRVAILVATSQAAGSHTVTWNANQVPSGIYLVRVRSGGEQATRKVTLVR